jgi:hypothetical protein
MNSRTAHNSRRLHAALRRKIQNCRKVPELATVLDAAAGLTRLEAENAFSLSLVRHGRITPDAVWELKTQILRKSGSLELHRGRKISEPRRIGVIEVVLSTSHATTKSGTIDAAISWCAAVVAAGLRQVAVLQSSGTRSRSTGVDSGRRQSDGLAGRPVRRANTSGSARDRRHGSVCGHDR